MYNVESPQRDYEIRIILREMTKLDWSVNPIALKRIPNRPKYEAASPIG